MKNRFLTLSALLVFLYFSVSAQKSEDWYFNKMRTTYTKIKTSKDKNPFLNVKQFYDVIYWGEQLLKNHPDTKYFIQTRKIMLDAIEQLADIHIVDKYGIRTYYHLYCNTDFNFVADHSDLDGYIEKYPDSKFSPVFKKIKKSPSEIVIPDDKNFPDTIYFIVVRTFATEYALNAKKFELLNKGYDFPHSFIVQYPDKQVFVLVYRFFTDPQKAKTFYEKIKPEFEFAYILKAKPERNTKILTPLGSIR